MTVRIPKIKSASYDGTTVVFYDEDDKRIEFKDPIFIHIKTGWITIEWVGSGPSGPWTRQTSKDFEGVDLGSQWDGVVHKEGMHMFGRTDERSVLFYDGKII